MIVTIVSIIGVFVIGLLIGIVIGRLPLGKASSLDCGEIIVNTTDPMKDVLKFALDVPVTELMSADKVTFRVVREDS